VLAAGRRWGKNYTGRNWIIKGANECPGGRSWVVTPSYTLGRDEYNALTSAAPELIRRRHLQPCPTIVWWNYHETNFRSADKPDFLRGGGLDRLWLDEATRVNEETYRGALVPRLLDRGGRTLLTSTFWGRDWFYHDYELGLKPENWRRIRSFLYPSWTGVAFQGPEGKERLADLKLTYPGALWDQEVACIPAAKATAVFRTADLAALVRGQPCRRPEPGRRYILPLDLGRVVDPSALLAIDDQLHVCHAEERPLGEYHRDGATHAARMLHDYSTWTPGPGQLPHGTVQACLVIDATGGATGGRTADPDVYVKEYEQVIPSLRKFWFNEQSKRHAIERLALHIEKRAISIPPEFAALHAQLGAYEYTVTRTGVQYHNGKGHRDDLVMALAMGVTAWEKGFLPSSVNSGLPLTTLRG
jgi:hypothetical protein